MPLQLHTQRSTSPFDRPQPGPHRNTNNHSSIDNSQHHIPILKLFVPMFSVTVHQKTEPILIYAHIHLVVVVGVVYLRLWWAVTL